MILSSHMVIGGAIGARSKNIYWAFFFGFLSHYLLDFIPHWEYLSSLNQIFIPVNILKVLLDFALGLLAMYLILSAFSRKMSLVILVGMGASILPDALQTVIYFLKLTWLTPLFNFHQWIHCSFDLTLWPGLVIMACTFLVSILVIEL